MLFLFLLLFSGLITHQKLLTSHSTSYTFIYFNVNPFHLQMSACCLCFSYFSLVDPTSQQYTHAASAHNYWLILMLHCYIVTFLHFYIVTLLHYSFMHVHKSLEISV